MLSTETPCPQDGLILAAAGWDLSRIREGVRLKMFYNHATWGPEDFPVGAWEDVQVRDKKLCGRPVFASEEHPERAGVLEKLWRGGFLDDVSVSFSVDSKALTGPVKGEDGREYMVSARHTLREASVVGIGADQEAGKGRLEDAVSRGVITRAEADAISPAAPNTDSSTGIVQHADPVNQDPHDEGEALRAELAAERSARQKVEEQLARLQASAQQAVPPATPAPAPVLEIEDPAPESRGVSEKQAREAVRVALKEQLEAAVNAVMRKLTGRLPD